MFISFIEKNKDWHQVLYKYITYLLVFLIIATYTGVFMINPKYLTYIHTIILYYVCAILLIRFYPYRKQQSNERVAEFDRKIAFTAGVILLTTILSKTFSSYISTSNSFVSVIKNLLAEE